MTRERQRAMAQYEDARIKYRQAVRSSLGGASKGEAIREAIRVLQAARAELARHPAPPAVAPAEPPARDASLSWKLVRRLLTVG